MQTIVVDSISKGTKFVIDHSIEEFRAQGAGEDEYLKEFMKNLYPGDIVFDIGASIGAWTVYCSPLCKKIYTFEPDPELVQAILSNVKANDLSNIEVLPYALSDNSKGLSLFTSGRRGLSPSVVKRDGLLKKIRVKSDTIDAIVGRGEVSAPSVFKIGIEGAEYLALSGATNTLKNVRMICLELHPKQLESLGHTQEDVMNLLNDFELISNIECSNSWNGDHIILKKKCRDQPEAASGRDVPDGKVELEEQQLIRQEPATIKDQCSEVEQENEYQKTQNTQDTDKPPYDKKVGQKPGSFDSMVQLLVELNTKGSKGLPVLWEDCESNYLPDNYIFLSHHQFLKEAIGELKKNSKPTSWLHWIASGLLKFYLPSLDLMEQKVWLRKLQFLLFNIEEKLQTQSIEKLDIAEQYFLFAIRYCITSLYLGKDLLLLDNRQFFADVHSTLVRIGLWKLGCLDQYDIDLLGRIRQSTDSLKPGTSLRHDQYFPCLALMLYRKPARLALNLDSDLVFSSYLNELQSERPDLKGNIYRGRVLAGSNRPDEYALWYLENYEGISSYWNRHRGESCFIIGNGSSLRQMDMSPLRRRITFGLNKIYLLFDKFGFETSYLVAANPYVIQQAARELSSLSVPQFIAMWGRQFIQKRDNVLFLRENSQSHFMQDITKGVCIDCTVTYVAMQIAYYMGFETVILIGVDHSFESKGDPHKTVKLEGGDPNHFDPNYFGYGTPWQLPDLEGSERAYLRAKTVFEADGRQIIDATAGGKLQIFPKISYEDALSLT